MARFLIIVMLLASGALMLAVDNYWTILLVSILFAGCGGYIWFEILQGGFALRLSTLLAGSLLFGYGFGSVLSFFFSSLTRYSLFSLVGVGEVYVGYAYFLVASASALLLIAAHIEPPLPIVKWEGQKVEDWFVPAMLGLVVLAYAHGDLGMQGASHIEGEGPTPLGELAVTVALVLAPIAALGFIGAQGFRKRLFGVWLVLSIALLMPITRRSLVYGLLITLFAAVRIGGARLKLSLFKQLALIPILLVVLTTGLIFFLGLRLVTNSSGEQNSVLVPIYKRLPDVLNIVESNPGAIVDYLSDTTTRRAFIIDYPARLAHGGNMPSPMYGQDMFLAFRTSIPRPIYRYVFGVEKPAPLDLGAEEQLANSRFGMSSEEDDANSILSGGIIDFGTLGALVYPLLVVLLYRVIFGLIHSLVPSNTYTVTLLPALVIFCQTEQGLDGYFSGIRSILVLAVLWTAVGISRNFLVKSTAR